MNHPFCPYTDASAFCQVCGKAIEKHKASPNALEVINLIRTFSLQEIREGLDKIKESNPLQYAMIVYFFDNL